MRTLFPEQWHPGAGARLARGNDFPRALSACILNKVPPEDRKVIGQTFDHHVGPMGKKAAGT